MSAALEAQLAALHRDYQHLLARLESNQAQFQQLARSVYRVQEDERRRLARELHDGLGQNLTALQHLLGLLLGQLPSADDRLRQQAEQALAICRSSLEDTRQLARLLRPQILDDLGLAAALRWLCRSQAEATGLAIELSLETLPSLGGEIDSMLFRLVQEALTNATRHAQAERIEVQLRARAGWLRLTVSDDGIGLPAGRSLAPGTGLGGMQERVRLFGGQLQLEPGPAGGLRVSVRLPIDSPPASGPE